MSTKNPFSLHIVRSDGQTLDVGDGTEWVLSMNDMSDWVPLDYGVETSANVLTDGSTLVSKRVNEKDRTIRCVYWGRDRKGVRDRVISFFNPKYSFEAHLTYFGRTRWCEGEQIGFEMGITDERTPPSFTWTLLCLDPYMRSEDGNDYSLSDSRPMFGFPFVSHVKEPTPSGERKPVGFLASKTIYDGLNTVYNSGMVPAPFRVTISGGTVIKNPKMAVNDRFVQYAGQVNPGSELVMAFDEVPSKVYLDGKNVTMGCTRESTFVGMRLDVGRNTVTFTMDDMQNMLYTDVRILYNKRYTGV